MDFLMMAKLISALRGAWKRLGRNAICGVVQMDLNQPVSVPSPVRSSTTRGGPTHGFLAKDLILWFFWSGYNSISSWSCHSMLVGPLRCHLTRCCWVSKLGCHLPRTSTAMACSCKNDASWNFGKLVAPSYVLMLCWLQNPYKKGSPFLDLYLNSMRWPTLKLTYTICWGKWELVVKKFFCWTQQFLIALAMKTLWVELQDNLVG